MIAQTKILESLNAEYETEKAKIDALNATVQEIKTTILQIKGQLQTIDGEIQTKQKTKDDISENVTKKDAMVKYHRKNIRALTDAMTKYEVGDGNAPKYANLCGKLAYLLLYFTERIGKNAREIKSVGGNGTENWITH